MSKQTLKFSDMVVNKKEFYASKQAIPLDSVNTNNIVVSYRIKHNDDVIRPLCIILLQMSGYIKYFDNGGKTCHLKLNMKVCF